MLYGFSQQFETTGITIEYREAANAFHKSWTCFKTICLCFCHCHRGCRRRRRCWRFALFRSSNVFGLLIWAHKTNTIPDVAQIALTHSKRFCLFLTKSSRQRRGSLPKLNDSWCWYFYRLIQHHFMYEKNFQCLKFPYLTTNLNFSSAVFTLL